ncbi:MAG TPA: PilT/PilU family type 4a pilus ATPase [Thermoanaerobaculia bacterium]
MALFQSDLKETVRRLSNKDFASPEERDELLSRLGAAEGVRARDVVWMLFRPDRMMRDAAVKLLAQINDPETVDAFVAEARGKPDAALRSATTNLGTLGIAGLEQRVSAMLAPAPKETKESREMQGIARRILLESPVTEGNEPLLWQVALSENEERTQFLAKLATATLTRIGLNRWRQLAVDADQTIRERALEVLAKRAPQIAVDLFIQELPTASEGTRNVITTALATLAAREGLPIVDKLLPLVASGDAPTRAAAMKILIGIGDPAGVLKRYIKFANSLAGFVRTRALESVAGFPEALLPATIDLLRDPDPDVRSGALSIAAAFQDARITPATIELLKDSDWWIRISAADTLGRLEDPRAVEPLVASLADPDVKWSAVEALGRIADPRSLPPLGKLLADPAPDVRIEVLQALRNFKHPQVKNALMQVAQKDADRSVRARAIDLLDEICPPGDPSRSEVDAIRVQALAASSAKEDPRLNKLLVATRNQGASDFHLTVGQPPTLRLAADLLRAQGEPFTADVTEAMLKEVLTETQWAVLQKEHQIDFCYFIPQAGRYRANVFFDQRGYNGVFRVIPEKPPSIADIGLPEHLAEIADYHQGLVIICGPSGSGKSTTLAALVNLFNETRTDHVLTMEDPVEFVHPFKQCLINQREVGTHTVSYARALRAALREDPDVIVIGELRDNESISLALTAAETGHIVLGTLNSTSAPKAVDRVISSFPIDEQPQVRASMSESLKYVIAQRLLPSKEPRKLVAAFEILKGTSTVANMIRDEKTFQIYSAMQIGRSQGMQTIDEALRDLLERQKISPETAYMAAVKKEDFEPLVSQEFLKSGRR